MAAKEKIPRRRPAKNGWLEVIAKELKDIVGAIKGTPLDFSRIDRSVKSLIALDDQNRPKSITLEASSKMTNQAKIDAIAAAIDAAVAGITSDIQALKDQIAAGQTLDFTALDAKVAALAALDADNPAPPTP